jgi:hypothetical protein
MKITNTLYIDPRAFRTTWVTKDTIVSLISKVGISLMVAMLIADFLGISRTRLRSLLRMQCHVSTHIKRGINYSKAVKV